jgi:hypothetical protein
MKTSKTIIPNRETDVRPLSCREHKMDNRKGMIRIMETVNIRWAEQQKKLFDL